MKKILVFSMTVSTFMCVPKSNTNEVDGASDVSNRPMAQIASVSAYDNISNDTKSKNNSPCPGDMVEIEGDYCNNLEEICLKYGDPDNKGANGAVQCLEFKYPTKCLSSRTHMHYCIDKYAEIPNKKGELPITQINWFQAKEYCEKLGKRLCTRPEFTQACRGPKDKPYPYGDGYHRDCTACNCDREPWLDPATHTFEELDKRVPIGSMERCVSDYGVFDMVGNNDRFIYNESEKPYKSALMGGHAIKGARNRCSPSTLIHNEYFTYYVTGSTCCKNIEQR